MAPLQRSNIGTNYLYRFKSEGSGTVGGKKEKETGRQISLKIKER